MPAHGRPRGAPLPTATNPLAGRGWGRRLPCSVCDLAKREALTGAPQPLGEIADPQAGACARPVDRQPFSALPRFSRLRSRGVAVIIPFAFQTTGDGSRPECRREQTTSGEGLWAISSVISRTLLLPTFWF